MSTTQVEYVGSFEELLDSTTPADARFTKITVSRLPNTAQLHERYSVTFAGPEALQLLRIVTSVLDQLANSVQQNSQSSA